MLKNMLDLLNSFGSKAFTIITWYEPEMPERLKREMAK